MADRPQMALLMQNLLSNAVKFHDERGAAGTCLRHDGRDRWVFSVSDNGIGIDPDTRGPLFGMFQRLHPGRV